MAVKINGRDVLCTGVLTMHGHKIAEVGDSPKLRYSIRDDSEEGNIQAKLDGDGSAHIVISSLKPGDDFIHSAEITMSTGEPLRVFTVVRRVSETSSGPAYQIQYTAYIE